MIEVQDLKFEYAAQGFSLEVPALSIAQSEHVAFTGASGCGKTTLAYLLAGIFSPRQGRVSIHGASLFEMTDSQRRDFRISRIGFIFQDFELLDYLRLDENILLPYLVNLSMELTPAVRQAAKALADSVGLGEKLRRHPGELSQGEKQRLAICRALITQPDLLLADEPTGNLDADTTQRVMDLIQEKARERKTTFLMITHDRSLLDRFDRVVDVEALLKGEAQ